MALVEPGYLLHRFVAQGQVIPKGLGVFAQPPGIAVRYF